MAHLSVRQRWPLRKSFVPSRRHNRQTASLYLAKINLHGETHHSIMHWLDWTRTSDPSSLRRAAAVVRDRSDVSDQAHVQARRGQRTYRRFAARPRSLQSHFNGPHAVVASPTGGSQSSLLSGKRCALPRSFEPQRTRAGPSNHPPVLVRDTYQGVVKARLNVNHSMRHNPLFFLLEHLLLAGLGWSSLRHNLSSCSHSALNNQLVPRDKSVRLNTIKSSPWPSSCWQSSPYAALCGCAHWCGFAALGPGGCAGAAGRDTIRFQSSAAR